MDLREEDIKKGWQEYTEELYKKDLHDPDNHDGVITHLESDTTEATQQQQQQQLLGPYHFCPLLCPCLNEMFPWYR